MKILITNYPWITKKFDSSKQPAVKAGSRWPHFSPSEISDLGTPPIDLGIILKILSEKYNVKFIDAIAEKLSLNKYLKLIEEFKPNIIITEISTPSINSDNNITNLIKKKINTKIVYCGSHCTALPNENYPADYIILGQYHYNIKDIINSIIENKSNNKIFQTSIPENNIETIYPLWEIMKPEKYFRYQNSWSGFAPEMEIITSRGCYSKCNFCLWPQIMMHHKIKFFSADTVIEQIKYFYEKYNVKGFYFNDDTFTLSKKHVLEICDALIKANLPIKWSCFGMAKNITKELIIKMKQAGCTKIKIGVESGNEKVLELSGKNTSMQKIRHAFKIIKKIGMDTHASFTVGFPEDDINSILDTYNFAIELNPDTAVFSLVTPFPGTELFKKCDNLNLIKNYNWDDYQGSIQPVIKTQKLSQEQLKNIFLFINNCWNKYLENTKYQKFLRMMKNNGIKYIWSKFYNKKILTKHI